MADKILVTPEELRAQASQVRACAQREAELIERLTNLTLCLDAIWDGDAQAAFVARYEEALPQLEKLSPALETLAGIMETTAGKMEQTDQALKRRIAAIS